MNKFKSICFLELFMTLPAIMIGAVAMRLNGVPSIIYLQNIICFFVGWLISCLVIYRNVKFKKSKAIGTIILILILYILTFSDSGIGGVHRWISLGFISLHISSIFLPIVMIALWEQLEKKKDIFVVIMTIMISVMILFQPDAAQLTAFAIPMMIILYNRIKKRYLSYSSIGVLMILIVISWKFLDSLSPVIYVEEIVALVVFGNSYLNKMAKHFEQYILVNELLV